MAFSKQKSVAWTQQIKRLNPRLQIPEVGVFHSSQQTDHA